jgi:hypothetical protein
MRKFAVGLAIIALLAFAGESGASQNGTADPLGLISSAVIQPFWSGGAGFTLIELTSPVWYNIYLHGFWFNASCTRLTSFPKPLTRNDVEVFAAEDYFQEVDGLLVLANSLDFDTTFPIFSPIHSRGHWVNFVLDFVRVIDPIAVVSAETLDRFGNQQTYSPLRSAASFTNAQEDGLIRNTTIFLICPTAAVYGIIKTSSLPEFSFPTPPLTTTSVLAVIFNNEEPEVDLSVSCTCLTPKPVLTIDSIYAFPPDSQEDSVVDLWYTELYAYEPASRKKVVMLEDAAADDLVLRDPVKAFTGYIQSTWFDSPFLPFTPFGDGFSRLFNASAGAYLNGDLGGR